jgi:hypothetical protein
VPRINAAFPDLAIHTVWASKAQGPFVYLSLLLSGTHNGPLHISGGPILIPATNARVEFAYTVCFRFSRLPDASEAIFEAWPVVDALGLLTQIPGIDAEEIVGGRFPRAHGTHRDLAESAHRPFSLMSPDPAGPLASAAESMTATDEDRCARDSVNTVLRYLRLACDQRLDLAHKEWLRDGLTPVHVQGCGVFRAVHSAPLPETDDPNIPNVLTKTDAFFFQHCQDAHISPDVIMYGQQDATTDWVAISGTYRGVPITDTRCALHAAVTPEGKPLHETVVPPSFCHVRVAQTLYFHVKRVSQKICARWGLTDMLTLYSQLETTPRAQALPRGSSFEESRVLLRFIRAFEEGVSNIADLRHLVTPTITDHTPAMALLRKQLARAEQRAEETAEIERRFGDEPHPSRHLGSKSCNGYRHLAQSIGFWHRAFESIRVRVRRMVIGQGVGAAFLRVRGRHAGPLSGNEATHDWAEVDATVFVTFGSSHRVANLWTLIDCPGIYTQLGLRLPDATAMYHQAERRDRVTYPLRTPGLPEAHEHFRRAREFAHAVTAVPTVDGMAHTDEQAMSAPGALPGAPQASLEALELARQSQISKVVSDDPMLIEAGPGVSAGRVKRLAGRAQVIERLAALRAPFGSMQVVPNLACAQGPFSAHLVKLHGLTHPLPSKSERELLREAPNQDRTSHMRHYRVWRGVTMPSEEIFSVGCGSLLSFDQTGRVASVTVAPDRVALAAQLGIEAVPPIAAPGSISELYEAVSAKIHGGTNFRDRRPVAEVIVQHEKVAMAEATVDDEGIYGAAGL